jgi:hypothetical protein
MQTIFNKKEILNCVIKQDPFSKSIYVFQVKQGKILKVSFMDTLTRNN